MKKRRMPIEEKLVWAAAFAARQPDGYHADVAAAEIVAARAVLSLRRYTTKHQNHISFEDAEAQADKIRDQYLEPWSVADMEID